MWGIGAVFALALVFTAPWDTAAVRRGIWEFDPARTGPKIGVLPWEEYLFFLWQSGNVIGSVVWLLRTFPGLHCGLAAPLHRANGIVLSIFLSVWMALLLVRLARRWNYARHLFHAFLPVVFGQWILAPRLFLALWPVLGAAALFWGTYYTAADAVAVRRGVWYFDATQITGLRLGGILPWEEAAFFYLTSLLVAQSYLLLLPAALR